MKKIIIIVIALMAMTILSASVISYWTNVTSYAQIPWNYGDYSRDRVATIFEPAGACVLNSVDMQFYAANTTNGNATATIRRLDTAGNIVETGLGAPAVTVLYANLVYHTVGVTTFDFSALPTAGRSFAAGEKFAIVLSCPNGVMNTVKIAPLGGTGAQGHSYNYWSDDGWGLTTLEWCWDADVTYTGPYIDVAATNLTFTGDFFLQPEDAITYEADVTSNSSIAVNADVTLTVYKQADNSVVWTHTLANQAFPVSVDPVHFVFPTYTYPALPGEFDVKLTVVHASDMATDNNTIDLEQITFLPPGNMDYSNDARVPTNAFGWNADNEPQVGVNFWYGAAPLKLNTVGFRVWDATWPANVAGHEFLKYAIYNWVEGLPNLLYVTPAAVPCVLGQWNDYDVSALNLNFGPGENFMVTYVQYNLYPACPGLAVDDAAPISGWATSFYKDPVEGWSLGYDDDFMIRAGVEEYVMGVEAPIISIALDPYPSITWAAVPGALSYNVYGSNDPEAANPWTLIEGAVVDLGYLYEGTESFKFFYVTASTEADGSKKILTPQMSTSKPTQTLIKKSVKTEKAIQSEGMITPALTK